MDCVCFPIVLWIVCAFQMAKCVFEYFMQEDCNKFYYQNSEHAT